MHISFTFLNLKNVAENVKGIVIDDCGHFVAEEQPEELTEQLLSFFAEAK
jgi:pimeloyl-ACP methyl ester carboxylesterase